MVARAHQSTSRLRSAEEGSRLRTAAPPVWCDLPALSHLHVGYGHGATRESWCTLRGHPKIVLTASSPNTDERSSL